MFFSCRIRLFLLVLLVRSSLLSLGEAAPAEQRPNILLAISDDQSYPHASIYGYPEINTPALDRVAREGVLFTHGFVASPGCAPSRASLLTGRYPWQNEQAGTHAGRFPQKYVTYPDLLEQAEYTVGYTGKGWGPGNWQISGRKRNPAGPAFNQRKLKKPSQGINNNDYAANFADFLEQRPPNTPFCFWYGCKEPHRSFEQGIGQRAGKNEANVQVPGFLPDEPLVRSDILDYCVEIEWFDLHLGKMLQMLEESGELDNTIVIVTSDNGMAFPRAKANCFEFGFHVPLAIRWPRQVPGGRTVDDLVSLVDLAPTILQAASVVHPGKEPMSGKSLMDILTSKKQGLVDTSRRAVFSARERHSSSRWNNLSYPQRAMRTRQYLYVRNFRPQRWPAGAPRKYDAPGQLGPQHGGYHDIDACPTLSFMIENRHQANIGRLFHLAVDKRPAHELYDIENDPACLNNLAEHPDYAKITEKHRGQLEEYLLQTQDPRAIDGGEVFETYKRFSRIRKFPPPDDDRRIAPQ